MMSDQYSPLGGNGYISSPSQSGTLESFSPHANTNSNSNSNTNSNINKDDKGLPISPRISKSAKGSTPSPRNIKDSKRY